MNTVHTNVLAILNKPMDKSGKVSPSSQALQDSGLELQQPDLEVLAAYAVHDILQGINAKNFRQYLAERTIFARMFGTKAEAVSSPDFQDSETIFKNLVSKAPAEKLYAIAKELDKKGRLESLLLPDQITRITAAREQEKQFQESLIYLDGLTGLQWRIHNPLKRMFSAYTTDKAKAHTTLQALKKEFNQDELKRESEVNASEVNLAGMRIEKENSTDEFGDKTSVFKSASFFVKLV